MSGCLLVLGVLLAAQVNSAGDRYGSGGQSPPPAATESARDANDGNLLEILETPSNAAAAQAPAATPPPGASSPYVTPNTQPSVGDKRGFPPAGASSRSQAISPPPGYGLQTPQARPPATAAPPGQSPGLKPSAMMRAMLTAPRESQLAGRPTSLGDVVVSAASRAEQTQRVEAYWDLCSSLADYYLGLREQDELRRLRSLVPSLGPAGEQAERELAVRVGTSQRAAFASQFRLASLINGPASSPLPADIPHCGSYHPRYDEVFDGRSSAEAQELAALLPLRYAELKDAATAVTRAEEWLNAVATASSQNGDPTATLRALELLALRRRAFVQIARDYNRRIARYSELATPGQIDTDRLIGMLIKRDAASTATRPGSPASPLNRQSRNASGTPPSTFADGNWAPASSRSGAAAMRDEAVEQASSESEAGRREERSLLVPRQ